MYSRPPGSTFRVPTTAGGLQAHDTTGRANFVLPDGRSGAQQQLLDQQSTRRLLVQLGYGRKGLPSRTFLKNGTQGVVAAKELDKVRLCVASL